MQSFISEILMLLLAIAAVAALCVRAGKLTVPAAVMATFVGFFVAFGTGPGGLLMLAAFFVMGVAATSHKKQLKAGVAGLHQQKRKAGQVFANGGVAAILGLLAVLNGQRADLFMMMLAASLAAATADTLSSELGILYGRRFVNILTLKKEPKGLDGVISLEGTLLGAAGALVIAVIYAFFTSSERNVLFVLLAGIIGNFVDSLLGAALERKGYIGNDAVNFLNTLAAALVALAFYTE